MNYHIMTYGATTAGFIEDIYAINEENNNVFIVIHAPDKVSFQRKVLFKTNEEVILFLQKLEEKDNIYIHYYHAFLGEALLKTPNKLFTFQWGGDFFEDPINYHKNRLYDRKTLNYYNRVQSPYHLVRNPINYIKIYLHSRTLKQKAFKLFLLKSKYIDRIDFIINSKENTGDLLATKALYPNFQAKHLAGSYDSCFELTNPINNKIESNTINVLLGNSASYANNHIDALYELKKYSKHQLKIYSPLTYGSEGYGKEVIRVGKTLFKDNFIPLTTHLDKEKYIDFLKTINVAFFFHKRSQAFGNILLLLSLGIPVYLRNENSLKSYFDNINVKVFTINNIKKINIETDITIFNETFQKSFEMLMKSISRKRRLEELKELLNN